MTTTPQAPGGAPAPRSAAEEARMLVARLAADAAARQAHAVPAYAGELGWLAALPPAVRRTVIGEITQALTATHPDTQQREVAAALSRGRDLASHFTR